MPVARHFDQLDERLRKPVLIGVIISGLGLFQQPANPLICLTGIPPARFNSTFRLFSGPGPML